MKTAFLCAILFCSFSVSAVENQSNFPFKVCQLKPTSVDFSFVRGHKNGKGHSLQWSMTNNSGIESFEIQSTYEDPTDPYSNWYTVGNVINTNQKMFRFTDQTVLPGIINYRIVAIMSSYSGTVVSPFYTTVITK